MPIDPKRSRQIHALKRQIGMTDEQYRDMLRDGYGVETSLDLPDDAAAERLIMGLRKAARQTLYLAHSSGKKYDDLSNRSKHYASPAQMRMLEAMWADVSRAKAGKERERALNAFLGRFKVKSIVDLPRFKVKAVRRAIEDMQIKKAGAAAHREVRVA